LYRVDPAGAAHYYTLHDRQGHLFSRYSFTVAWGKNLSLSREKIHEFDNQKDMDAKIRAILRDKLTHDYKVLYSYLRPEEMTEVNPILKKYAVS
jgi:predicted DNA-binding WGR domain protein